MYLFQFDYKNNSFTQQYSETDEKGNFSKAKISPENDNFVYCFDKTGSEKIAIKTPTSSSFEKFPFSKSENDKIDPKLTNLPFIRYYQTKDQNINLESLLLGLSNWSGNTKFNILNNFDKFIKEVRSSTASSINCDNLEDFSKAIDKLSTQKEDLNRMPFGIGIPGHIVGGVIEDGKLKILDQGGLKKEYVEILIQKGIQYKKIKTPKEITFEDKDGNKIKIRTFLLCRDVFNLFINEYKRLKDEQIKEPFEAISPEIFFLSVKERYEFEKNLRIGKDKMTKEEKEEYDDLRKPILGKKDKDNIDLQEDFSLMQKILNSEKKYERKDPTKFKNPNFKLGKNVTLDKKEYEKESSKEKDIKDPFKKIRNKKLEFFLQNHKEV